MFVMAERKTRAVPRRASAKKAVTKEVTKPKAVSVSKPKKTVKKVTKKVSKKTTKKNAKKTKTSSKKVQTESSEKIDIKIKTNKFLTNKTESDKKTDGEKSAAKKSTDAVSLETTHRVAVKDKSITIFSRVRTDNTVMLVARVLGMAFIFVGALFAVLGVGATNDGGALATSVKQLDNSFVASLANTISTHSDNSVNADQFNSKPTVKIDIPSESVSGVVDLNFSVASASKIFVRLYDKKTGLVFSLGNAKTTDGTLWKYQLDTTKYSDGDYYVSAHITNSYGAYVKLSADVLKIDNTVSLLSNASSTPIKTTVSATSTGQTENNKDDSVDNTLNEDTVIESDIESEVKEFELPATDYLKPSSVIFVSSENPVSDLVTVSVKTSGAQFTELYVRQKESLRDTFIGLAQQDTTDDWKLVWDTKDVPNGEYTLLAKHKNKFGFYWSDSTTVIVKNKTILEPTAKEKEVIDTIVSANDHYENPLAIFMNTLDGEVTDTVSATTTVDVVIQEDSNDIPILKKYKTEIENAMQNYTSALRKNDITERRTALLKIDELKNTIVLNSVGSDNITDYDKMKESISARFEHLVSTIEESQRVIAKRIGEAATEDSDIDGITDYDELTLYKTNPFSADTDNDGFTDEVEILAGFDPNSDIQESSIVYESPKESGVIREDVLAVDTITTEKFEKSIERHVNPVAILSGRALPNSFVTIYIFSTPIVITVKTSEDGTWNYRFNKELEDGQHEVFVGITDNSGKIVAKSNPFTFVKEAEAFNPVGAEINTDIINTEAPTPSLLNQSTLLVASGAVVMALGFILILLTLYFSHSRRKELVSMAHAQ